MIWVGIPVIGIAPVGIVVPTLCEINPTKLFSSLANCFDVMNIVSNNILILLEVTEINNCTSSKKYSFLQKFFKFSEKFQKNHKTSFLFSRIEIFKSFGYFTKTFVIMGYFGSHALFFLSQCVK